MGNPIAGPKRTQQRVDVEGETQNGDPNWQTGTQGNDARQSLPPFINTPLVTKTQQGESSRQNPCPVKTYSELGESFEAPNTLRAQ